MREARRARKSITAAHKPAKAYSLSLVKEGKGWLAVSPLPTTPHPLLTEEGSQFQNRGLLFKIHLRPDRK